MYTSNKITEFKILIAIINPNPFPLWPLTKLPSHIYEIIRLIKQPKEIKYNFGSSHNLIIIASCINETNSPYLPYTSIPKLSLLQGRSVKTCNCNYLS